MIFLVFLVCMAAADPDPDPHFFVSNPNNAITPTLLNPTMTNNVVAPVPHAAPATYVTANTPSTTVNALPYGVINTDHAYGYTGNLGYYNGQLGYKLDAMNPTLLNPTLTAKGAAPEAGAAPAATVAALPYGVINTDHAYGYTGNNGYYNGYHNNWGGYSPLYSMTQEETTEDQNSMDPRVVSAAKDPLATVDNRVLVGGYPYGYTGQLGHNNGYLSGYPYTGQLGYFCKDDNGRRVPCKGDYNGYLNGLGGYLPYGYTGNLGYYNGYSYRYPTGAIAPAKNPGTYAPRYPTGAITRHVPL